MMNQKHALITCLSVLLAVITVISAQRTYPICTPPGRSPDDRNAHFVFFVDRTLEAGLLTRLFYLLKAISCEIPLNKNIEIVVASYSDENQQFTDIGTSGEISKHLTSNGSELAFVNSTRCSRFQKALGRAPASSLEHSNVQFMVPIFEDGSGCSMLKVFQEYYQDDPRKDNYFFNGILINSELTSANNQSIRMAIPDFMKAINPGRISLVGSKNISDVHASAPLVQSYASMIRDILLGNSVHDWEEIPTTPGPSTSESPTTTEDELALFKFDGDDEDEAKILELNLTTSESESTFSESNMTLTSEVVTSSESSTTTSEAVTTTQKSEKRAATTENSTSSATSSESTSSESTSSESQKNNFTNIDYDPDVEQDTFELELANGVVPKGDHPEDATSLIPFGTTPGKWSHLETDTMIYLLLLFLLIWFFCLFLCLVWMFYCAKKKKEKLENEAEQQQSEPLLESGAGASKKPETDKKSSTASDEGEDEWKSIKPSIRTEIAPKSETESVKPVAARYDPVEVSEFEKNDEDFDEKPRHGYIPAKKTQELQFD